MNIPRDIQSIVYQYVFRHKYNELMHALLDSTLPIKMHFDDQTSTYADCSKYGCKYKHHYNEWFICF